MSINSKMCVIALCFYFSFHCLIVFTMCNFVDVLTNVNLKKRKIEKKNLWCVFSTNDSLLMPIYC